MKIRQPFKRRKLAQTSHCFFGQMNLPGGGQLLGHKSGWVCVVCTHRYATALHSRASCALSTPCPPISSLVKLEPQFYSSVSYSLLNMLWRLRGICPLGSTGGLVLPTRKVQSLRTYKHLRLLTGTPCLTRVIRTSLFMVISDILRDSHSGASHRAPHPTLS